MKTYLPQLATDMVAHDVRMFHLTPAGVSLVLVDMQRASAARDAGLGRRLADQGMTAEAVYRFNRLEEVVVGSLSQLLAFFRELGLPVIHIRLGASTPSCADLIPSLRGIESWIGNYVGHPEFEFLEELAPQPGEPIISKLSASAFNSSNLDMVLRNRGIRQLVVGGVSTAHCVDMTARDAADRGYEVVIVEDGCAEDTPDLHATSLRLFEKLFGRVASASTVIGELSSAVDEQTYLAKEER